jgi:hypothetical protein
MMLRPSQLDPVRSPIAVGWVELTKPNNPNPFNVYIVRSLG